MFSLQVFKAFANMWSLMTDFMLAEDRFMVLYSESTVKQSETIKFSVEFILAKVLLQSRRMELYCQFCFWLHLKKLILRFSNKIAFCCLFFNLVVSWILTYVFVWQWTFFLCLRSNWNNGFGDITLPVLDIWFDFCGPGGCMDGTF